MPPDERRLRDILAAADELAGFLDGVDEAAFLADRVLVRATERLLTVVGEAAKHLGDETRQAIDQPWRSIIRFRDRGVHLYDALSPATLYRIATESTPELADAVRRHLGKGP